ncbi:MAG: TonB family protein [Terriglobales bacterium]
MLQATPTRGTVTWVDAVFGDQQCRRLVIAMVLLLAAITAVLVRDRDSLFANDNGGNATADSGQPVSAPSAAEQAPSVPAAEAKPPVATQPSAKATPSHTRSSHPHSARLAGNSVKRESPRDLSSASAKPSATWGPATAAAERAPTPDPAQAHPPYPLLTQATSIQGSVLLQALIAADGAVEELRVISGPTILVSAARQAVQQWRFKPYLLNGKPVETFARVTVKFAIDVSNTEARVHVNSVTSAGAL